MNEPTTQTQGRRKRGCLRLLVVVAVFLSCCAAALWTGYPQRWLVESLASAGLGTDVSVDSVSLGRRVKLRGLHVSDSKGAATMPPLLAVDQVELEFAWPPWGPRLLKRLFVQQPVIIFDARDSVDTNYDFWSNRTASEDEMSDPFRFLPKTIDVRAIRFESYRPNLQISLTGIDLGAQLRDDESWEAAITGTNAMASWRIGDSVEAMAAEGAIELRVQRDGKAILAEGHAGLPNLLQLAANARIALKDNGAHFELDVPQLNLRQAAVGLLPPGVVPVESRFEQLDLSRTRLTGALSGGVPSVQEAQVHAAATALSMGPPEAPYFAGDVAIQGSGNADKLELLATFGAGQQAHIAYGVEDGIGAIQITLDGWTRDQIRAVLPAIYINALDGIPNLKTVSGEARIRLDEPPSVESTITATLGDKSQTSFAVRGSYDADVAAFPFAGNANLTYADGNFALETIPSEEEALAFAGKVDKVRIKSWVAAVAPGLAPLSFDGVINGSVQLKKSAQDWQSQLALSLGRWNWGG